MIGYLYICGCVAFTVYGQLVLKWRINKLEALPEGLLEKFYLLVKLIFTDFYVFSGFSSAFVASIFWMAAMTKFSLSFAYPFMSLAFVLVMFASFLFFGESLNIYKVLGTFIIVIGLVVLSRGY